MDLELLITLQVLIVVGTFLIGLIIGKILSNPNIMLQIGGDDEMGD